MEKLLIVEFERNPHVVLADYLGFLGFHVLRAFSMAECLRALDLHDPALVLLDGSVEGINSSSLARQIRERGQHVGLLLVLARGDDAERIACLEAGADGYLIRPFSLPVLLAHVRSLLRRCALLAGRSVLVEIGPYRVDLVRRRIHRCDQEIPLTSGEFCLLVRLYEVRGQPVERHQLLESLRPSVADEGGDLRTVDTLIARLRRKLERNSNRPELIQTVYGKGYRLADERELELV
ncbi:response regulator transcription factor [Pseudomonas sp. LS44]|uniref:response regulator transcription factor n=1 Tax=Pseudomonas sp. LS44 TaxID=1357074 RepID=UPI00215B7402|nr:response regulator transcription factor [Pseudomonas sp. LS44]UVE18465.1 response regulator transcription factor [Pseudomonas sp. LS44]